MTIANMALTDVNKTLCSKLVVWSVNDVKSDSSLGEGSSDSVVLDVPEGKEKIWREVKVNEQISRSITVEEGEKSC